MPPRGLTNPTPKTESARSALSSFTCTLCNKSYSRQPEYEAHISSYDHQHRKRLQDLKQLSRDPNAAEKARRAEKKADAEAGLRVINTSDGDSGAGGSGAGAGVGGSGTTAGAGGGGGGFKKGGFKSSFSSVKGPPAPVAPTKKNVLEDDEDDDDDEDEGMGGGRAAQTKQQQAPAQPLKQADQGESDTDEEYSNDQIGGGYYDPRTPTGCSVGCAGAHAAMV